MRPHTYVWYATAPLLHQVDTPGSEFCSRQRRQQARQRIRRGESRSGIIIDDLQ